MFKKTILCYLILFMVAASLTFAADIVELLMDGKKILREGYSKWDVEKLMEARGLFERAVAKDSGNYLAHYYLAYGDYHLIIYFIDKDSKSDPDEYADEAVKHLEQCIKLNGQFADAYALLSGVYGLKIRLNWLRGITMGPKSNNLIEKAIQVDTNNPRNYLMKGISLFNTPSLFGGSKSEAKKNFQIALEKFAALVRIDSLQPDWGKEETYVWLGLCFKEEENYAAAKEQFEKALTINPEYGWVKYQLLPELQKKMSKR